jgi:hypothetical protein
MLLTKKGFVHRPFQGVCICGFSCLDMAILDYLGYSSVALCILLVLEQG